MSVAGRADTTYINPMRPSFRYAGAPHWSASLAARLAGAGRPLADAIDEIDADVLFLRHALAPGSATLPISAFMTAHPAQSEPGRSRTVAPYRSISSRRGDREEVILSSRWCRCVETAAELGLGPFTTHDGLNSFFDGHVDRAETIRLLRAYLDKMNAPSANGPVTLMVTHQVVITAITGIAPQSGGLLPITAGPGRRNAPARPCSPRYRASARIRLTRIAL